MENVFRDLATQHGFEFNQHSGAYIRGKAYELQLVLGNLQFVPSIRILTRQLQFWLGEHGNVNMADAAVALCTLQLQINNNNTGGGGNSFSESSIQRT